MNETDELIEELREIARTVSLDAANSKIILDAAIELRRLYRMAYLKIPISRFLRRSNNV